MALPVERTAFLLGTWKGRGKVLPKGVEYLETFTCLILKSEPAMVINWQQFTKHAESLKPMHAENGFLKILPKPEEGEVKNAELMLSHPFSVNEYYKSGRFDFAQNVFECSAETEAASLLVQNLRFLMRLQRQEQEIQAGIRTLNNSTEKLQ